MSEKPSISRSDTEDLSKAVDDDKSSSADDKSPKSKEKDAPSKRTPKKKKKANISRQNTRQQAIDSGKEFLENQKFDPSRKRSRRAPNRLGAENDSSDDDDSDAKSDDDDDDESEEEDDEYGKPKRTKKATPKKSTTKRKRASTSSGSARKAQKTGSGTPARKTRSTSKKAAVSTASTTTTATTITATTAPATVTPPTVTPPKPITPQFQAAPTFGFTSSASSSATVKPAPIDWRYETGAPTFAVSVSPGGVWIGDQNGQVTQLDLTGAMQAKIKLPAGVKCIVNDFQWLYAGCDNGVVYDLTNKKEPRNMYDIHGKHMTLSEKFQKENTSGAGAKESSASSSNKETKHDDNDITMKEDVVKLTSSGNIAPPVLSRRSSFLLESLLGNSGSSTSSSSTSSDSPSSSSSSTASRTTPSGAEEKRKHVVFAIDISSSMSGARINTAKRNMEMIYKDHIKSKDLVSLITFGSNVSVKFSGKTKEKDDAEILKNFGQVYVSGMTAFWDAVHKGVDILRQVESGSDINKFLIALTDGDDNQSSVSVKQLEVEFEKSKDINFICVAVGTVSRSVQIRSLCDRTSDGIYIAVSDNNGIDGAFKLIAQILGAEICWMDINDGRLAVSDAKGNASLLNSEGFCMWTKKSPGRGGWMVAADPSGVYHGHSKGVTKYNLRTGDSEWSFATTNFTQNPEPVVFGAQTYTHVFAAAGKVVFVGSKDSGSAGISLPTDVPVSSTVPSKDGKTVYAADVDAHIYSFEFPSGKRNWKLKTECGTALSMACDTQDRLFIVTTLGTLACIDVHADSVKAALEGRPRKSREVQDVKEMAIVQPDMDVETTKEIGNGILLECVHDISDAEIVQIHNAIHDRTATSVQIQGETFQIEKNESDCRYCVIHQLTFIEQNKTKESKYATMAKAGQKITWVVNGGRWGLVIDGTVERNGTACVVRVCGDAAQSSAGKNLRTDLTVQFPKNLREVGRKFVVDSLVLAEDKTFYRTQGSIKAFN